MSNNILFDNLIITDDETIADDWAAQTYDLKKKQIDKEAVSIYSVDVYWRIDNQIGYNEHLHYLKDLFMGPYNALH